MWLARCRGGRWSQLLASKPHTAVGPSQIEEKRQAQARGLQPTRQYSCTYRTPLSSCTVHISAPASTAYQVHQHSSSSRATQAQGTAAVATHTHHRRRKRKCTRAILLPCTRHQRIRTVVLLNHRQYQHAVLVAFAGCEDTLPLVVLVPCDISHDTSTGT